MKVISIICIFFIFLALLFIEFMKEDYTVYTNATSTDYLFTTNGTFTIPANVTATVTLVGGGNGGPGKGLLTTYGANGNLYRTDIPAANIDRTASIIIGNGGIGETYTVTGMSLTVYSNPAIPPTASSVNVNGQIYSSNSGAPVNFSYYGNKYGAGGYRGGPKGGTGQSGGPGAVIITLPLPVNCSGGWSDWSGCSASCGGGTQTQTYTIYTPAQNGGAGCPSNDGQTQTQGCNTQGCPVDCVGSWSDWSGCSASCGGGTQIQTYNVSTPAQNGGAECPAANGQTQPRGCNTQGCPVNCVGSWGPLSQCTATCGGGTQTQTYTVSTPAQNGGVACTAASGQTQTQACNNGACTLSGPVNMCLLSPITLNPNFKDVDQLTITAYNNALRAYQTNCSTVAAYNATSNVFVCPASAPVPSIKNGVITCSP